MFRSFGLSILILCVVFVDRTSAQAAVHPQKVLKTKLDFVSIKQSISSLLSLIRSRYELDGINGGQFFLSANNINPETWDMLKYKFAMKMLSTKNETFLMVFGGSSVTAGHDSYYNQSYPTIVRKRLEPIMKHLNIDLVVNNIALGANNCAPYILCYEAMGGLDPDFVGWEQVQTLVP